MNSEDILCDVVSDSEFEYEYDDTQTETFLIDVDLSSVNGYDKSNNSGLPKSLATYARKKRRLNRSGVHNATHKDNGQNGTDQQLDLQILELQSLNPLLSYEGQIYSCKWVDMFGTNMFLSPPGEAVNHPSELATNEYNLLGLSRIKLVGHRAITTPSNNNQLRRSSSDRDRTGSATAEPGLVNNTHQKPEAILDKQKFFLQQLQNIKLARGEHDNVHGL